MTTLVITCRTCGKAHTPTPQDIRAGHWRICDDCREPGRDPPKPTRLNALRGLQLTEQVSGDYSERTSDHGR